MLRIAHIINPIRVGPQSDLYEAQPYVWQAMRIARDFAVDVADVRLIAVCYAEDAEIVPEWLTQAPQLTRSSADLAGCGGTRKLPLIADILAHGVAAAPDADYFIYSNADIIVMPFVYRFLAERLAAGMDTMAINRRTIPADTGKQGLSAIWSAVGKPHDGHDFFVFSRSVYERMQLDQLLIGVPLFAYVFKANIVALGARYEYYPDTTVLTKHLGDDRSWKVDDRTGLVGHNIEAADRACAALGLPQQAMTVVRARQRPTWRRKGRQTMRRLWSLVKRLRFW